MKRKSLKWAFRGAVILLVGWCLTSLMLSQIVLKHKVVVKVTGETGATMAANVTVA